MAEIIYHQRTSPEANERKPEPGDVQWDIWFDLDNGDRLIVKVGLEGLIAFKKMLREMEVDDQLEELGLS